MSRFRRATSADLDVLLPAQRRYYLEDGYAWDEAAARGALADLLEDSALGLVWIAEHEHELQGYVVLTFGYSLEYRGRDAFVDEIFFLDAYRRRGLGREALELVDEACRAAGVRALHLEVERDKQGALALYRSVGFEDRQRFLMTKRLDASQPLQTSMESP
jgi:ribosomal protein S18 acetylase RimI-like enzyme